MHKACNPRFLNGSNTSATDGQQAAATLAASKKPSYDSTFPQQPQAPPAAGASCQLHPPYTRPGSPYTRLGRTYTRHTPAYTRHTPAYTRLGLAYTCHAPAYTRLGSACRRHELACTRLGSAYIRHGSACTCLGPADTRLAPACTLFLAPKRILFASSQGRGKAAAG